MPQSNPPRRLGTRHKARTRAVELLFEADARGVDPAQLLAERVELAERDRTFPQLNPYARTLVQGVADSRDRVDAAICGYLKDWTLERLPGVDRAILRVAVWELFHAVDVPPVVVVDEAVELAKQLSTDESPGFVNGVLGQAVHVAPQVRAAAAARRPEP
jgi:transcription antitermination protein NusB